MTKQTKPILTADGVEYEWVAYRQPNSHEWMINTSSGQMFQMLGDEDSESFIQADCYRRLDTPPVPTETGIERRGNYSYSYSYNESLGDGIGRGGIGQGRKGSLNPLLDAACAVINEETSDFGTTADSVEQLAAALEPFVQQKKPAERFYVDGPHSGKFYIGDRTIDTETLAAAGGRWSAEQIVKTLNSLTREQVSG